VVLLHRQLLPSPEALEPLLQAPEPPTKDPEEMEVDEDDNIRQVTEASKREEEERKRRKLDHDNPPYQMEYEETALRVALELSLASSSSAFIKEEPGLDSDNRRDFEILQQAASYSSDSALLRPSFSGGLFRNLVCTKQ